MSKRGADEYITKEHGSTPNKSEESKSKMATAAQMAKRNDRMAAPKSRLNRTPAGASTPSSNPFGGSAFGSAQPQSQPTFGGVANGVAFGQSQSFPPGGSSSGSGFNFSVPAQSTSFTFGQPVQNNPFASLNGAATQEANKSTEDTVMESPQKKPTFAAGGFGSSQTSAAAGGSGLFGGFGQSTSNSQQPPSISFGQSQPSSFGSGTGLSLFGQSQNAAAAKPQESSVPSTNLFGQSTVAQPSPSKPATANGLFAQSSQQIPGFEAGKSTADTPKSPFTFGQPQTQAAPTESVKAPSFGFGQPSQAEATSCTPSFSFGQSTTQSASPPKSPQPAFAKSLFEAPQNSTPSTLFKGSSTAKQAEAPQSAGENLNAASVVGESATASPSTAAVTANPFAGLFGQTVKSSTGKITDSPKPLFNFTSSSQPQNTFGSTKALEPVSTPPSAFQSPSKPLFGVQPSEGSKSSTLFSLQSQSQSQLPEKAAATPNVLFGSSETPRSNKEIPATTTPTKPAATFSFGQAVAGKPVTSETPDSKAGSTPAAASTPATVKPTIKPTGQSAQARDLFTPKPADLSSANSMQTIGPNNSEARPEDPKHTIFSNPPARIPPYLNAEKYKSYDSNYRLHSLNREFQKRVAMLDPSHEDFENIVRVYVAARESIGESIGLYTRNIAGMKRKGDQRDDDLDELGVTKKTKSATNPASQETISKNSIASSVFQPVPSGTKAARETSSNSSSVSLIPGNKTTFSPSSLFPPSKSVNSDQQTSSSQPASSLFSNSNVANSDAMQSISSSRPVSLFGNVVGTGTSGFRPSVPRSTTPPSSPPKQPGFSIPKFGASASTDFMSAFKKQSEASTAKFEKDAMEKRKAEEFDSDDDDEAAWTKKYYEEQQAKKAKIGAFTGFKPNFGRSNPPVSDKAELSSQSGSAHDMKGNSAANEHSDQDDPENGPEDADDDEEATADDNSAEDEADEDDDDDDDENDDQDSIVAEPMQTNGKSLFDRISRAPDTTEDTTPPTAPLTAIDSRQSLFGNFKATPEAPSFSPITPSTSTPYKPATTFSFTPTPRESPTPTPGASVFNGGITKDGPIPGEGLFGSRSSTPVNGETPKGNVFGSLGASQNTATSEDHTWKKGSVIKFGSESQAPSVSITAPSPIKNTNHFQALFGTGSAVANDTTGSNTLGFGFGASATSPAPGFLGAVSHLAPGSGNTSGLSSRATSPGGTDNESVATNDSEDAQADPQSSLLAHSGPYPGEENEDILFEARAKVLRNYKEAETEGTKKQKGWNVEGIGPMRVLKNKDTGKTRIVARAEPNANVILNANLTHGISYKANGSTVVVPVFGVDGPVQWMIKVKTSTIATELAAVLEKNNSS